MVQRSSRVFEALRRWSDEAHLISIREAIGPAFVVLGVATTVAFFFVEPAPLLPRFFEAYRVGFGAMGLALAILLAERLARAFAYSRVAGVLLSFAAFAISLPPVGAISPVKALETISSTSLFLALVVGLIVGETMRLAHRGLRRPAAAIFLSAVVTAAIFGGLAVAHVSLSAALIAVVKPLVKVGDTLPALLVVVFFQTLLWFAGVHGPAFLAAIVTPVYLNAIDQNSQAALHHLSPPYVVTIMVFTFVYPGGSGATLPLGLLLLRSRVHRLRRLGLASLLPNIANVNELLLFGVPVVMNPTLLVPFVGAPLALSCITYASFALHFVDRTTIWLPGAVPSVVAAWITTGGDWRAVVLVIVNLAVSLAIYLPFVRAFEAAAASKPEAEAALVKAAEAIREREREIERQIMHHETGTRW